MKYEQIEGHREWGRVSWLCSALTVSRSGYYAWRRRGPSARARGDQRLLHEIRASHEASDRVYGSPRIAKDLRALGYRVSEKRVARLMRGAGITATPRRRRRPGTPADHDYPVTPNVLARNFTVKEPNRAWVADITYIPTEEGWLYLAVVMDLFSRRIVGWHTASRIDRRLVLTALERALRFRTPSAGWIHHSDQGSQYASYEYQQRLTVARAVSSMSRRGDCYDNAAMESFFGSLKKERVNRRRYWTQADAATDIENYIEAFYNRRRRHSHTNGISPVEFEYRHRLT
jgi:putative transposase